MIPQGVAALLPTYTIELSQEVLGKNCKLYPLASKNVQGPIEVLSEKHPLIVPIIIIYNPALFLQYFRNAMASLLYLKRTGPYSFKPKWIFTGGPEISKTS